MRRARRPVIVLSLAVLTALAGCGGTDDVTREQFQDALEDGGMTREHAECSTDAVFDDVEQSEINAYYADDDVSPETEAAMTAAVAGCP